jgi:hypothetical protein
MPRRTVEPGTAQAQVELRRARICAVLQRPAHPVGAGAEPLPAHHLAFLRREAEELYWNELAWEELTDEEVIAGGHLTELVFPAFLTFVDGLLIDQEDLPDGEVSARPHPDAVEEILTFLGGRYATFTAELQGGIDSQKVVWARAMTQRLIDLVLSRLYRLSPSEREQVELG